MFATEHYVQARRGSKGSSRFVFMQKLVTEYQDTPKIGWTLSRCSSCVEARRQIIANLANFAYDPYNFAMIEELHIVIIRLYLLLVSWICFWMAWKKRMSNCESLAWEAYATALVVWVALRIDPKTMVSPQ